MRRTFPLPFAVALVLASAAPLAAGELVLNNVTLTGNFASAAGGGNAIHAELGFTIRNSVMAQNPGFDPQDCTAAPASVAAEITSAYNLVGVGGTPSVYVSCLDGSGTGDQVGSAATPLDAELGLLDDHGGATATHDLAPLSPLRDAGDPDGCDDETATPLLVDQRGEPRPEAPGGRCDIGAFEALPFVPALDFYTLTPCRLFDSRSTPPALVHGVERDVVVNGLCGVPADAAIAALNLTAVEATGPGGVNAYAQGAAPPPDSTLRFPAATARANNAVVALAASGLSAQAALDGGAGSVELVVDVNGYFAIDQPPLAVDDTATMPTGSPATAIDVLNNDVDPDGGALIIAAVTQPLHGTVAITGGGTGLTYDPDGTYCSVVAGNIQQSADDAFSYELAPGGSTAVVRVATTCACFTGDTLVWTENGLRPIAELRPGDRVWGRGDGDLDGAPRLAVVGSISTRSAASLLRLRAGGEELRVTPEHPFWTARAGWTRAGDLVAGDILTTHGGAALEVAAIEELTGPETVYNLRVEDLHTFFVGPSGVWVHNK